MKMFIACFLASFGFALIFNIPRDKAFYAGLTGGIGGIVYHLCLNMNLSETAALQIATQIGRCGQVNRSELATISGRC